MSYIPPKEWQRLLKRVFAIDPEGKLYVIPDPVRDIIPDADDAYDLGSSTKRWRYLFLSRQLAADETIKIKDIDPTPVGDVLLKVLDQVLKVRNSEDTTDVELSALRAVLSGDPPLSVVGTSVVTNLNADLLDGLHADEIRAAQHGTYREPADWSQSGGTTVTVDSFSITAPLTGRLYVIAKFRFYSTPADIVRAYLYFNAAEVDKDVVRNYYDDVYLM